MGSDPIFGVGGGGGVSRNESLRGGGGGVSRRESRSGGGGGVSRRVSRDRVDEKRSSGSSLGAL